MATTATTYDGNMGQSGGGEFSTMSKGEVSQFLCGQDMWLKWRGFRTQLAALPSKFHVQRSCLVANNITTKSTIQLPQRKLHMGPIRHPRGRDSVRRL